jgi:peptidoglycan/xylan/chitin deacetylase (PgdA/CDA1 family)
MSILHDFLVAETAEHRRACYITLTSKLQRWRRKARVMARPNAIGMLGRRFVATTMRRAKHRPGGTPNAIVLAYHRVVHADSDPQSLCVQPHHFAEQLAVLRQQFQLVPLRELVQRLSRGRSVAGTAAITFDDGYADNLHAARPALEGLHAPATVFVASDHIGNAGEFWWDELDRLLLQPGTLPTELEVTIAGHRYSWKLGDDACYDRAAFDRHRAWSAGEPSPTRRHQIYSALSMMLPALTPRQREDILERLRAWAGQDRRARVSHRTLTESETVALAAGDLIEIGAHTAAHPVLSMLPVAEQKREIEASKRRLEAVLERPVVSFAYPYGALSDYGRETIETVQAIGFESACTTFDDVVRPGADPFQLPRMLVRDWDGERFSRELRARM